MNNKSKQSLILWIAVVIIIFLAGYIKNTNSSEYPVNGTVDLSYSELSFSFDKVYRGKGDYTVWLAGESKGVTGQLLWRNLRDSASWQTVNLNYSGNIFSASIPHHPPMSSVEYRVMLTDNGKSVPVPHNTNVILTFLSTVPSQIMMFYYITLFAGLLLALRTGVEIFKEAPRIKMYTIFTLISFFSFTWIFSPVKKGCEIGMIGGTKIAPVNQLFATGSILLFALWVGTLILVFNTKKPKIWAAVSSLLTLAIYLFTKF